MDHTVLGSVSRQKVGGKMVCVRLAAEPSFGQHWAVVGALLTPECERGWANKTSGWLLIPLNLCVREGDFVLHSLWPLLLSPAAAAEAWQLVMAGS